jgi:Glutathione S-transferase, N-terminal domain
MASRALLLFRWKQFLQDILVIHLTQEELQVPYEIKKYQRTAEMSAPQTLKEVHPLGKSPIITDGAVTLAESGAITGKCITIWPVFF